MEKVRSILGCKGLGETHGLRGSDGLVGSLSKTLSNSHQLVTRLLKPADSIREDIITRNRGVRMMIIQPERGLLTQWVLGWEVKVKQQPEIV